MAAAEGIRFDPKRDRLVIVASTLGTIFEWYDFFLYGILAALIGRLFFPIDNPAAATLASLAAFGAGFGVRPLGAMLFGHFGDRLGRKYTFLVTITVMGLATTAIGVLPTYASAGLWAPALLVSLRLIQGLALGGEYGGAAIYVAEHAPANRRGEYTSWIQMSVVVGFLLCLAVVLLSHWLIPEAAFETWGWRVPFLVSLILLAAGYPERADPAETRPALIILAIFVMVALSAMTYSQVAAILVELFPPQIRYTSLSIPYHIGSGYFGGFLPFIQQLLIVKTGNPMAGLWYTFAVIAAGFTISLLFLKESKGADISA